MSIKIKLLSILGFIILIVSACDSTGTWEKQENSQIKAYIDDLKLRDTIAVEIVDPEFKPVEVKPAELYYIELQPGIGRTPVAKDTVSIKYSAMFLDRVVFDTNLPSKPLYVAVVGSNDLIPGLDKGVRSMKEGGKGRFVIQSNLAYGQGGVWGTIPGYTPLLYEIELVSVKAGARK
jgi:FKBP-type peptidyl-prolyl cis-trans isomerase FkpA